MLQISEERTKFESIIENIKYVKSKRRVKNKDEHCMPPGKGIWMPLIYSTSSPPSQWKLLVLILRGAAEANITRKRCGNQKLFRLTTSLF